MEVCGGQTHGLLRYGIDQQLASAVRLIHGPGCPVCVTPLEAIDLAIELAQQPEVTLASVGDMLRTAMRDNPYLKVLVQGGYYDAACDYFNAIYTMRHLQPGGEFKNRYRFAWYESGHMMYLRKADLKNANDDLRGFIAWALESVKDYPRKVK